MIGDRGIGTRSTEATLDRVRAERAALHRVADIRRVVRQEEGYAEAGAALTSSAGRGVRGSGRQAKQAEAYRDLQRDLEIQKAELLIRDLGLVEEEARAVEIGARKDQDTSVELARALEARAALHLNVAQRGLDEEADRQRIASAEAEADLRRTQIRGRYDVAAQQRAVSRTELAGQESQRGKTQVLLGAREQRTRVAEQYGEERAVRREYQGRIETATESLNAARSQLSGQQQYEEFYRSTAQGAELDAQRWQIAAGKALGEWQLGKLPDLPDFGSAQTRNTINTFLNIIGD